MRVWRISRFPSLDGKGGMLASNRWHTAPRPIIYCADHPSTALIEVLVHLEVDYDDLPQDYVLVQIDIPDAASARLLGSDELVTGWQNTLEVSRMLGDAWFDEGRSFRLTVPSVILPFAQIHLLNVQHPDFADVKTPSIMPVRFDPRLWKSNLPKR